MVIAHFDFSSTRKPPGFMKYHRFALDDLESGKSSIINTVTISHVSAFCIYSKYTSHSNAAMQAMLQ